MTNVRLAPFLFLLLAALVSCGSPAPAPGAASRAPAASAATDLGEISLEISALM
jgi:hypothetical protein